MMPLVLSQLRQLAGESLRGASLLPTARDRARARRDLCFVLLVFLSAVFLRGPIESLITYSFHYRHASHTILIPWVSLGLLWFERKRIFATVRSSYGLGVTLLLVAGAVYAWADQHLVSLNQNDYLWAAILSLVLAWLGGFVLCYGAEALQAARFPLSFLLFMIPIPNLLLEKILFQLQAGSSEVAYGLFKLTGVPVYREGFLFSLPGLTIEIAEVCSGIRSSLALLIVSLLAGHLFLRSSWSKCFLGFAIVPIVLFQNGLRIVTISLLAIYVDRGILTGPLHRRGGVLFFLLSLGLLALVQRLLQHWEEARPRRA